MPDHEEPANTNNYATFRECFTSCIGESMASQSKKPTTKRRSNRPYGRQKPSFQPIPNDEGPADAANDEQLSDFLEVTSRKPAQHPIPPDTEKTPFPTF